MRWIRYAYGGGQAFLKVRCTSFGECRCGRSMDLVRLLLIHQLIRQTKCISRPAGLHLKVTSHIEDMTETDHHI